jgi:phosphoserine phosphatase RsbU/P
MRRAEQITFLGGLTLVSLLALIDLFGSMSFVGALLLGVLLTSLAAPPRKVALVGAYALGWVVALGYDGRYWTAEHATRFVVVVGGIVLAVIASAARERQHRALVRTANVAEVAQRALLRPLAEHYDDVEMAVRYLSSSDGALVGGDAYDAEVTRWGLRVLIADVCGHGLEAVDRASTLAFAFREAAHTCETLAEVVAAMESSFRRSVNHSDYATALLLEINGGTVKIANCGHPDPAVIHQRRVEWLSPRTRARPIGLGSSPTLQRLVLAPGKRLLVYTDGLTEARDPAGSFFDLEKQALGSLRTGSLDQALDQLMTALHEHTDGSLRDDVIAFAVQVTPKR